MPSKNGPSRGDLLNDCTCPARRLRRGARALPACTTFVEARTDRRPRRAATAGSAGFAYGTRFIGIGERPGRLRRAGTAGSAGLRGTRAAAEKHVQRLKFPHVSAAARGGPPEAPGRVPHSHEIYAACANQRCRPCRPAGGPSSFLVHARRVRANQRCRPCRPAGGPSSSPVSTCAPNAGRRRAGGPRGRGGSCTRTTRRRG
jgi:hypothetical protein